MSATVSTRPTGHHGYPYRPVCEECGWRPWGYATEHAAQAMADDHNRSRHIIPVPVTKLRKGMHYVTGAGIVLGEITSRNTTARRGRTIITVAGTNTPLTLINGATAHIVDTTH